MCNHANASLVAGAVRLPAPAGAAGYLSWQCDDCGQLLRRPVTDDERATLWPAQLDEPAALAAARRATARLLGRSAPRSLNVAKLARLAVGRR